MSAASSDLLTLGSSASNLKNSRHESTNSEMVQQQSLHNSLQQLLGNFKVVSKFLTQPQHKGSHLLGIHGATNTNNTANMPSSSSSQSRDLSNDKKSKSSNEKHRDKRKNHETKDNSKDCTNFGGSSTFSNTTPNDSQKKDKEKLRAMVKDMQSLAAETPISSMPRQKPTFTFDNAQQTQQKSEPKEEVLLNCDQNQIANTIEKPQDGSNIIGATGSEITVNSENVKTSKPKLRSLSESSDEEINKPQSSTKSDSKMIARNDKSSSKSGGWGLDMFSHLFGEENTKEDKKLEQQREEKAKEEVKKEQKEEVSKSEIKKEKKREKDIEYEKKKSERKEREKERMLKKEILRDINILKKVKQKRESSTEKISKPHKEINKQKNDDSANVGTALIDHVKPCKAWKTKETLSKSSNIASSSIKTQLSIKTEQLTPSAIDILKTQGEVSPLLSPIAELPGLSRDPVTGRHSLICRMDLGLLDRIPNMTLLSPIHSSIPSAQPIARPSSQQTTHTSNNQQIYVKKKEEINEVKSSENNGKKEKDLKDVKMSSSGKSKKSVIKEESPLDKRKKDKDKERVHKKRKRDDDKMTSSDTKVTCNKEKVVKCEKISVKECKTGASTSTSTSASASVKRCDKTALAPIIHDMPVLTAQINFPTKVSSVNSVKSRKRPSETGNISSIISSNSSETKSAVNSASSENIDKSTVLKKKQKVDIPPNNKVVIQKSPASTIIKTFKPVLAPLTAVKLEEKLLKDDHYLLNKAKPLKRKADAETDKTVKIVTYLESVVSFVMSIRALTNQNPKSSRPNAMIRDTYELLKDVTSRYTQFASDRTVENPHRFLAARIRAISLKTQALFCFHLYRIQGGEAMTNYKTISEHISKGKHVCGSTASSGASGSSGSSGYVSGSNSCHGGQHTSPSSPNPSPSPASSTGSSSATSLQPGQVQVPQALESAYRTQLSVLHRLMFAHFYWEEADKLLKSDTQTIEFLNHVEGLCGPLTIHSTLGELCIYLMTCVHWLQDLCSR